MAKFYLSQAAQKPVVSGKSKFNFEPCEFFNPTSSWWGIYGTEVEEEIQILDELVAKGVLQSINEEEFKTWYSKKKNPSTSHNLIKLGVKHSPSTIGAPKPAVVVEPAAPKVESADEAIKTAPVRQKK